MIQYKHYAIDNHLIYTYSVYTFHPKLHILFANLA